ncbi:trigger factor [Candidatus Peregrinibacteria bacterium CG10_big_fil_rev_8_21_14_0_10_55_24]|nr:MAG: trigger factor [Candidatus Peregrinibacteria bacterium CG10_big_fil_rev_8_21_14_0_10_55_24]
MSAKPVQSTAAPKRLKGNRIVCTVTFSAQEISPAETQALAKLGEAVRIPGFRPGKVPPKMLRERVDPGALLEETVRALMPSTFKRLVEEHDLKPIMAPKVEAQSRDPLTVTITFVEHPDVKVKGASKIRVDRKEVKIDPKDIDRMMDYVLSQHQKTQEVERAAQEGDQVTMDFWGEDSAKKEVAGTRTSGHTVLLGSKTLIPGFEEELIGMKRGDAKTFTLTFPEKYHAQALAGKPVTFHVTVTKVESVEKPQLTDAFVKEQLGEQSVDAFRKRVEESLRTQEEQIEHRRREEELLKRIREATVVDLAPELVEEEERDILERFGAELERKNLTLEQWLSKSGKKADELTADMRKQAENRLTLRFGIQKIAEEREIDLTDGEMEQAVTAYLSPLSPEERERVSPNFQKDFQGWHQLKWQKRLERLIEDLLSA